MFGELIRQLKRARGKATLSTESRRHAKKKTGQARISPQFVQVTEEFRYARSTGALQPESDFRDGVGTISVVTSIDDQRSLTTPGRMDLRALQVASPGRPRIFGSFLTFHNHGRTDLEHLVAEKGGFDSIGLESPVGAGRPVGQAAELGLLRSHQWAKYRIEQPTRLPIEAALGVAEGQPASDDLGHNLYFLLDVKLYLPNVGHSPKPRIGAIELDWPWMAESGGSVGIWKIRRDDYEKPGGFDDIKVLWPVPDTTFDTTKPAIVCRPARGRESSFSRDADRRGRELAYYYSILIEPKRPLHLIGKGALTAKLSVTFDSLLSGTEVHLHHSNGYVDESTEITTTTSLRAEVKLDLVQAMPRRLSDHRNILRFPGVQPSAEVIDTIRSAVVSCGYELAANNGSDNGRTGFNRRIEATRLVAGTSIEIALLVEGRRRMVNRTLRGAGGPRLREEVAAGDVDIELFGTAEGDHCLLTSEMNTLHASLRSRLSTFVEA